MSKRPDKTEDIYCPDKHVLIDYLNGNLDEPAIRSFESHLQDCHFCREALDGLKGLSRPELLSGAVDRIQSHYQAHLHSDLPHRTRRKSMKFFYLLTAIIIAILLFAYFAIDFMMKKEQKKPAPVLDRDQPASVLQK